MNNTPINNGHIVFQPTPNLPRSVNENHGDLPARLKITFPDPALVAANMQQGKIRTAIEHINEYTRDIQKRGQLVPKDFKDLENIGTKLSMPNSSAVLRLLTAAVAATVHNPGGTHTGGPASQKDREKIRKISFRLIRQLSGVKPLTTNSTFSHALGQRATPLTWQSKELAHLAIGYLHDIAVHRQEMSPREREKNDDAIQQILNGDVLQLDDKSLMVEKMLTSSNGAYHALAVQWMDKNIKNLGATASESLAKSCVYGLRESFESKKLASYTFALIKQCVGAVAKGKIAAALEDASRNPGAMSVNQQRILSLGYADYLTKNNPEKLLDQDLPVRDILTKPHAVVNHPANALAIAEMLTSSINSHRTIALRCMEDCIKNLQPENALRLATSCLSTLDKFDKPQVQLLKPHLDTLFNGLESSDKLTPADARSLATACLHALPHLDAADAKEFAKYVPRMCNRFTTDEANQFAAAFNQFWRDDKVNARDDKLRERVHFSLPAVVKAAVG
jgi:hypothetical protein